MASGEFTAKTRLTIIARSRGRCERCGQRGYGMQIHHRQPRGMGGGSTQEVRSAANGLYVHPSCHRWIESHRSYSLERGWLVPKATDPSEYEVRIWSGWVLLSANGDVTQISEPVNRLSLPAPDPWGP